MISFLSHIGDNEALGIAYLTLRWLNLLRLGNKIAVYLSDVSGAFIRLTATDWILVLVNSHIGGNKALGIAYLTLRWLDLLRLENKIAVYLSDVSSAMIRLTATD